MLSGVISITFEKGLSRLVALFDRRHHSVTLKTICQENVNFKQRTLQETFVSHFVLFDSRGRDSNGRRLPVEPPRCLQSDFQHILGPEKVSQAVPGMEAPGAVVQTRR